MERPRSDPIALGGVPVACNDRLRHVAVMNGFIIDTTCEDRQARNGRRAVYWIGIMASAKDMIATLPGHSPSVVDRGRAVLAQARALGLKDGEYLQHEGEQPQADEALAG